ncbi:MAG: DNA repair protein RadA [Campylobacterales bacterium]
MAKAKILYECQACGHQSGKWLGKCPSCGAWESFLELSAEQQKALAKNAPSYAHAKPTPITEVVEEQIVRQTTHDPELDLVLGGGIVPGSLVLIGGSPGIGKSTLLLKTCGYLAQAGTPVLYVSGEESAGQIKLRASRIGANHPNLFLMTEIRLEAILAEATRSRYGMVVIDSIQTIYADDIPSAPGSVAQVREITFKLMRLAKEQALPIFIIGHITKEGSIAGPRVLEHMVDTVLYFEGEEHRDIRILRAFKNRFGSTSEIGIFEMTTEGLVSATNIGRRFFERTKPLPGSAATVIMEGSRPLIIEVQALVAPTYAPNPKRLATGFENNRLGMLLALLERKLDLPFRDQDVFINISGGIKISEPSCDLAVIAAILSSFKNRPLSHQSLFLGEVGLTGDVRDLPNLEARLREAASQGFLKAIVPKRPKQLPATLKAYEVTEVANLVEWIC